jgi:hypothetical protein
MRVTDKAGKFKPLVWGEMVFFEEANYVFSIVVLGKCSSEEAVFISHLCAWRFTQSYTLKDAKKSFFYALKMNIII